MTTAVGARILPFVAPVIAKGLAARAADAPKLVVIACENAIGGTDILRGEVLGSDMLHDAGAKAVFANCAIDRIVPEQRGRLDVTLETFSEWVVDRTPFDGAEPDIVGITWVDDLGPFIERKLFTVNTAHATAAYHGRDRGIGTIREVLADAGLERTVRAVLDETKALLVAKHGFGDAEQQAYIDKTLQRIANPELPDTCERVGRGPLRKLGRQERFIGPAAQLAELGLPTDGLIGAVAAALRFDAPDDAEAVQLQERLRSGDPAERLVVELTGIDDAHPLFPALLDVVAGRLAEMRGA